MIKIEFKEATEVFLDKMWPMCNFLISNNFYLKASGNSFRVGIDVDSDRNYVWLDEIKLISNHNIEKDPYLDRSFILQQLGISKEQDEEMQQKYK